MKNICKSIILMGLIGVATRALSYPLPATGTDETRVYFYNANTTTTYYLSFENDLLEEEYSDWFQRQLRHQAIPIISAGQPGPELIFYAYKLFGEQTEKEPSRPLLREDFRHSARRAIYRNYVVETEEQKADTFYFDIPSNVHPLYDDPYESDFEENIQELFKQGNQRFSLAPRELGSSKGVEIGMAVTFSFIGTAALAALCWFKGPALAKKLEAIFERAVERHEPGVDMPSGLPPLPPPYASWPPPSAPPAD